jgi:hypothetical protein
MKRELVIILVIVLNYSYSQTVYKTMNRLPDTGQNTSYTTTFGEDADFTINPPGYSVNGNGTVTDSVTGLMWQQTDGGEMTIENAGVYCDTLALAGYTDWRLPDCHELFSILNHDRVNPAIDTTVFSASNAEYWWSSDKQANDSTKIWVTNAGGGVGNHPKAETVSAGGTKQFHVRAVRDIATPQVIASHFVLNANGTITDSLTGLVWQATTFADSLSWENALQLADTLNYAGYTDWRLPNIKELQSINDEQFINPSLNQGYFNIASNVKLWSSTTLPNHTTRAWYLDTRFGVTTYAEKTTKQVVVCVRNASVPTNIVSLAETAGDIIIYPNPFVNTIHFSKPIANTYYRLMNISGLVVCAGKVSETVEVPDLQSGIYIMQVLTPFNSIYKTLIKN